MIPSISYKSCGESLGYLDAVCLISPAHGNRSFLIVLGVLRDGSSVVGGRAYVLADFRDSAVAVETQGRLVEESLPAVVGENLVEEEMEA